MPQAVAQLGTWVLVGLLGVGALMNFASSSLWERFGWGPFTLIMCILCLVVARSRPTPVPQRGRLQVAAITRLSTVVDHLPASDPEEWGVTAVKPLSRRGDRKRAWDELSEIDRTLRLEAVRQRREAQERRRSVIEGLNSSRYSR